MDIITKLMAEICSSNKEQSLQNFIEDILPQSDHFENELISNPIHTTILKWIIMRSYKAQKPFLYYALRKPDSVLIDAILTNIDANPQILSVLEIIEMSTEEESLLHLLQKSIDLNITPDSFISLMYIYFNKLPVYYRKKYYHYS